MYNGVVIPQLDTNNTENLIYTLYLDWNLYQLTDNASYEADALLRANEFIAAYNPTQLMSNLGTPDREIGLFLQWAQDANQSSLLQQAISLAKQRLNGMLLPESQLTVDGTPIFGICAGDPDSYFLPDPSNGYSFRGGLNSQYLATAFLSTEMYNLTGTSAWQIFRRKSVGLVRRRKSIRDLFTRRRWSNTSTELFKSRS